MEKKLVYLAVPYTHPDPKVMEERYEKVCIAAGELISRNYQVYSPISQFHSVAKFCKLPTDWNYWRDLNKSVLECCRALLVLTLDGWKESVGVQDEIEVAKELGLAIDYLEYKNLWGVL